MATEASLSSVSWGQVALAGAHRPGWTGFTQQGKGLKSWDIAGPAPMNSSLFLSCVSIFKRMNHFLDFHGPKAKCNDSPTTPTLASSQALPPPSPPAPSSLYRSPPGLDFSVPTAMGKAPFCSLPAPLSSAPTLYFPQVQSIKLPRAHGMPTWQLSGAETMHRSGGPSVI